MHDRQLAEVLMERLVHRVHERCHWCRKVFRWVDGKFERFKGPDGNYYCCEKHASAQYLSSRGYAL
jgi:hypothetical protein